MECASAAPALLLLAACGGSSPVLTAVTIQNFNRDARTN
jgi:hypothetical protein